MAPTGKAAGRTRMDELRELPTPLDAEAIAKVFDAALFTVRRWALEGRKARDRVIAEHYGVTLETVRYWRRNGTWEAKAAAVDLEGVGVGYHMLPEATRKLGQSNGWDRDLILAWGRTAFDGDSRTRLDAAGVPSELVPTGRPPGIKETTKRRPKTPGRLKQRDDVVKGYRKRVERGESDWQARGNVADALGISRKQVARLLAEARALPDVYGEIPVGSTVRKPERHAEPRASVPAAKRAPAKKAAPAAKKTTTGRKSTGRKAIGKA